MLATSSPRKRARFTSRKSTRAASTAKPPAKKPPRSSKTASTSCPSPIFLKTRTSNEDLASDIVEELRTFGGKFETPLVAVPATSHAMIRGAIEIEATDVAGTLDKARRCQTLRCTQVPVDLR